jgi:hypothetical protein
MYGWGGRAAAILGEGRAAVRLHRVDAAKRINNKHSTTAATTTNTPPAAADQLGVKWS